MINNTNSLASFTKQYQLSKTLRFELKPIGQTAEWIKKHNIIGVENGNLVGVDAERAENYRYAKLLLNELHCLFIEDVLKLDIESETTKNLINRIVELSFSDEIKAADLPGKLFKNILDNKADEWINQYKAEMPAFWQEDIKELKTKISEKTKKKDIKYFNSIIKKREKDCKNPPFKKIGISALFSNEETMKLLEWKVRSEKVRPSFKYLGQGSSEEPMPKEYIVKYIRGFDKFFTYFTGFNENRANVYDVSGTKSTSLIHRIFMQNMQFHLANIRKWKTVKRSLEKNADIYAQKAYDWKGELAKCERECGFSPDDVFKPEAFIEFINQYGINRYNCILGGQVADGGKAKIQGINEFINLARQQAGAKRNEFPPLLLFYKQILSKSDKTFIAAFENDREMFDAVKVFHQECFVDSENGKLPLVQEFVKHMRELGAELQDEKEHIYISKDKLTRFSQELTGAWNTLNTRLLSELGEKTFNKTKIFSVADIEAVLNAEIDGKNFAAENIKKEYQSRDGNIFFEFFTRKFAKLFCALEENWELLDSESILGAKALDKTRENEGDKGFEQIAYIKAFLDSGNELLGFVKDWYIKDKLPKETVWQDALKTFIDQFHIIELYNKVRNHVTQKAYSTDKLKINFANSTLLNGWDRNKETDNYSVLLEKDGLYYLGIMTPESNNLFDYEITGAESSKKQEEKQKLATLALKSSNESAYRKINYKLLPGPNKMLPRVFFAASNEDIFKPGEKIINIKEKKLYSKAEIEKHGIKNLHDYIDFCKRSLSIHPEWSKAFGFSEKSFKPSSEYDSVDKFYKDVETLGYKISFDNIKESYISEKITSGELYLFQIYCKDFSQEKEKAGRDNLHTSYWKLLFSEENLSDTVLKLNGQAEIFFRKASIPLSEEKKKTGHHYDLLKSKFKYSIIKNQRFTEDKFFFHCPIGLNFKAPSIPGRFNEKVNTFLKNNPEINIIGIDRGEKHLLYYSVINQQGDIIEQGSLNSIANGFIPQGETEERVINYQEKLVKKEEERDKARKSWSMIENIKELKAGYLSQVVHKLSKLIVKHNAIVVLENLNQGFKRGRFKVERQVYQKFEKALIDKLNYLVFKNKDNRLEPGHYLNAYQLTNQFQSFEKIGKQSGILFYTNAAYTSTTDPLTGFLKNIYTTYESVEKSLKFWKSFDSIVYNAQKDRFEFTYTLGKIVSKNASKEKDEDKISKSQWTVCSSVIRSRYVKPNLTEKQKQELDRESIGKLGKHELFKLNNELKELFKKKDIDYLANPDVQEQLLKQIQKNDASFHKSCVYYFNAIMTMRVTDSGKDKGSDENDFILSPVEPFFDSRDGHKKLPENGDANGAYNIARKGTCILRKIDEAKDLSKLDILITKKIWQEYVQADEMVKRQTQKLQ